MCAGGVCCVQVWWSVLWAGVMDLDVCRCFWLTLVYQRNTLKVTLISTFHSEMTRTSLALQGMQASMLTLAVSRVDEMTLNRWDMSWCTSIEDLCLGKALRSVAVTQLHVALQIYRSENDVWFIWLFLLCADSVTLSFLRCWMLKNIILGKRKVSRMPWMSSLLMSADTGWRA